MANCLRFRSLSKDEQIDVKRIELEGVVASGGPRNSPKETVYNLLSWAQDNVDYDLGDLMNVTDHLFVHSAPEAKYKAE